MCVVWPSVACTCATAAVRRNVALDEDATDRGPVPAERPLTFEVLVEVLAVLAAIGAVDGKGKGHLLANHLQADDCFWVERVERAAAACAAAAAWVRCGGSRGHVAWRGVAQGSAVLERGVSLSAWRVARPVRVSGDLQRSAQPHDLRAGSSRGGRRGACGADAAQRGVVGGDLADQRGAAEAAGVGVMAGGPHRRRGGRCCGKHGRVGAAGGWGRC